MWKACCFFKRRSLVWDSSEWPKVLDCHSSAVAFDDPGLCLRSSSQSRHFLPIGSARSAMKIWLRKLHEVTSLTLWWQFLVISCDILWYLVIACDSFILYYLIYYDIYIYIYHIFMIVMPWSIIWSEGAWLDENFVTTNPHRAKASQYARTRAKTTLTGTRVRLVSRDVHSLSFAMIANACQCHQIEL